MDGYWAGYPRLQSVPGASARVRCHCFPELRDTRVRPWKSSASTFPKHGHRTLERAKGGHLLCTPGASSTALSCTSKDVLNSNVSHMKMFKDKDTKYILGLGWTM